MTKGELIEAMVAADPELSKAAAGKQLDAVCKALGDALVSSGRVACNLGVFTVKQRAAKTGRNPKTGEKIEIAAHKAIGFKPSLELRSRL